jgi:hypothetical protein
MAPLTDDERVVLMIAASGQSMIPIGRWEGSIRALHARGFLQKLDEVNYAITPAGRAASDAAEDDAVRDVIKVNNRIAGHGG